MRVSVMKMARIQVCFKLFRNRKIVNVVSIARETREDGTQKLIPFLVDKENNAMCFITVNRKENPLSLSKPAQFSTSLQETLKIHNSVNSFLFDEHFQADVRPFSIVSRYRQEYFHETDGGDASRSIDHYSRVLQRMRSYEMDTFDSFFWTSPETVDFFQNPPESIATDSRFLSDYSTHRNWISLREFLANKLQNDKDPCKFSSPRDKMEIFAVRNRFLHKRYSVFKF
jgi:hypothetical protein